jgi:hypothetical protein
MRRSHASLKILSGFRPIHLRFSLFILPSSLLNVMLDIKIAPSPALSNTFSVLQPLLLPQRAKLCTRGSFAATNDRSDSKKGGYWNGQ